MAMILAIAQFQGIDNLHIGPQVLDHLQFHDEHLKLFVLEIVIVIEISISIQHQYNQNSLTFITNEETLDHFTILFSEINAIALFLYLSLETDCTLEIINLHIVLHQDHILDLRLHLKDLSALYNQILLKIMTNTRKAFRSQKANLKSTCVPLQIP